MRRARIILDRLPSKQAVPVTIHAGDWDGFRREIEALGVLAGRLETPQVNAKSIRDKQGLSQPEFADLYGFEVDTLKNWEQGRNPPDGPTRVLLSIIERDPGAVIEARSIGAARELVANLRVTADLNEPVRPKNPWDWQSEWQRGYNVTYHAGQAEKARKRAE